MLEIETEIKRITRTLREELAKLCYAPNCRWSSPCDKQREQQIFVALDRLMTRRVAMVLRRSFKLVFAEFRQLSPLEREIYGYVLGVDLVTSSIVTLSRGRRDRCRYYGRPAGQEDILAQCIAFGMVSIAISNVHENWRSRIWCEYNHEATLLKASQEEETRIAV